MHTEGKKLQTFSVSFFSFFVLILAQEKISHTVNAFVVKTMLFNKEWFRNTFLASKSFLAPEISLSKSLQFAI